MAEVSYKGKVRVKQEVFKWLNLTPEERLKECLPTSVKETCRHYGITEVTYYSWRKQWKELKDTPQIVEGKVEPEVFSTDSYLKSKEQNVAEVLMGKILDGRSNAKEVELYYRLIGKLEKETIKDKENNDRINVNVLIGIAKQELEQSGARVNRVVEVQDVPDILHRELCKDTGQQQSKDSTVQTV